MNLFLCSSKLLQKLDQSVMTNQADIEAAMIDKSYMAKLLDLQSMRGAVGGKIFAQLLEAPGQSVNPADLVTPMELSLPGTMPLHFIDLMCR